MENITQHIVNVAGTLINEGKLTEARLFLNNLSIECVNLLASVLFQHCHETDAALHMLDVESQIDPYMWMPFSNKGHLLNTIGQHETALAAIDRANELSGEINPDVHYNRGIILSNLGRHEDAIQAFQRGLILKPEYGQLHYSLALALLRVGRWVEAWPEYEWRFLAFENVLNFRQRFVGSVWDGEANLNGTTVLVFNEQGFGDFINFSRFLPWLKGQGCKVVVEVQNELLPLYQNDKNIDLLIGRTASPPYGTSEETPPYDYLISVCSLMGLSGCAQDSIPPQKPLKAPAKKVGKLWSPFKGQKRIGLCYSGSQFHQLDAYRSIKLCEFETLADIPNSRVFLTQRHEPERVWPGVGKVDLLEGVDPLKFTDLSGHVENFSDLAYFVSQMDVVLTVDTAVAHLAGAMGKPTLMLTPKVPDWRWGLEGEGNLWYPSVRLIRQERWHDWTPAIERAKEIIRDI